MLGDEFDSDCTAKKIGSSLVEFTLTLCIIARTTTNTVPDEENTWRKAHDFIGHKIAEAIGEVITNDPDLAQYLGSDIIVEDIGSTAREVTIHADHTHCRHADLERG
jgi:hypothetical protein